MEIVIPGGRIIDRPAGFMLMSKLQRLHTAILLGTALDTYGDDTRGDVDIAEASLLFDVDGRRQECTARLIDINGRGLLIEIPMRVEGDYAYLYVQGAGADQPWSIATKMLLLSRLYLDTAPSEMLDELRQQEKGYVALYVGLALVNDWLDAPVF